MSVTPQKLLIYGAAFTGGLIVTLLALRVVTVPLTTETLGIAQARWNSAGVHNYDLSYRMHGVRYDVEVHENAVTAALVDGQPLQSAELRLYSMDGLFSILAMELDNAEDARPRPAMRVKFNESDGHLERYIRGSGGLGRATSIEMLTFTPMASAPGL